MELMASMKTHCPYCALQCGIVLSRVGGRRSPWMGTPTSRSTRAPSASRAGRRGSSWPTPIGSARPWSEAREVVSRPRPGTRPSPEWRGPYAPSRTATAGTRSASSAAAASPTRRRICSASSPASPSAPRTSTTTAASACRRRRRPRPGPSASTAGCPSRSRTSRDAEAILLVGGEPGRDDAAAHAVLRGPARGGRRAHRGRSAADRHRAAGRACTCGSARARTPRSPTASARARARPARRPGASSRDRTEGFDDGARALPRATGRSGSSASPACPRRDLVERGADPRTRPHRHGPDRARPRAAGAGRRQRARLHQRGARPRPARTRRQRLRDA